jgi:hypothetical protein
MRPSKIYPNWDFWFETKPSGNPASISSPAQKAVHNNVSEKWQTDDKLIVSEILVSNIDVIKND